MKFKPFFINHNLCQTKSDIANPGNFYSAVAGNVGNSFIAHSIITILYNQYKKVDGIANIWNTNLQHHDVDKINNEYTHIILIMQDQIRNNDSYYDNIDYCAIAAFLERLKIPLITFSLGSNAFTENEFLNLHNTLNNGMKKILNIISHKTPVIGVRGNRTAEILEKKLGIKNTNVIGCPSFYITGNTKNIRKINATHLNIACNGSFIPYQSHHNYYHILQDMHESKFIENIAFNGTPPKIENKLDTYLKTILEKDNIKIFSDMKSWGNFVRKMDLVIGTRVHCGIMALNQGTPCIITNGDFRAQEMCEFFKIPLHPEYDNSINLLDVYQTLNYTPLEQNYPIIYQNFLKYLQDHNLKIGKIRSMYNNTQPVLCKNDEEPSNILFRMNKFFKTLKNIC